MGTTEIAKIKEYQREYEQLFGKKLYISWPEMKGFRPARVETDVEYVSCGDVLDSCLKKHGASLSVIRRRRKRLQKHGCEKERAAITEYSIIVVDKRLNVEEAAKLINRDRTLIYHYAKKARMQGM